MPLNKETQARVELLVGIDEATYNRSKATIRAMFDDRHNLQIDDSSLKDFASKIRDAVQGGGKEVDKALVDRFDRSVGDLLTKYADTRKKIIEADGNNNEVEVAHLLEQQAMIEQQIEAESDAHKKRLEAADKLMKATRPSIKHYHEAGDAVASSFMDTLGKAQSGDMSGFVQSIVGAATKAITSRKDIVQLGAQSASSEGEAEAMGLMANRLAVAASALAVAGAGIAALLSVISMVDDQVKELNKSLIEGASMADFASKSQTSLLSDMVTTMDAARKASYDTASDLRGTSEEMAGVLNSLVQAGMSYKEIAAGSRNARTEAQAYAEAIKNTFMWSTALGISTGEVAEATAEWSTNFGADLTQVSENFAVIAKYASESGFNVKRFFTNVSQATAGMALYNVRMEEAAMLLSKTQKILGETDASEFAKSLTQGFMDESMTDRMKRIMIAGGKDTAKIFAGTAERTAKGFVNTFQDSKTQKSIQDAFGSVGLEATIFGSDGAKQLQEKWGELSEKDRRLVIARLRENNTEQSDAAARQLETLGRVLDATNGGLDAQAKGLGALDMQAKLAYKLQTLGDKRLNDMSAIELAAFENYAGISGSQLEQLMRVESQLMSEYELAKAENKTTAQSFDDWIASNEDAQTRLEDIKVIEEQASYFSRKSVENTRSVFSVLKNTIASLLNDIYQAMSDFFGWSKKMTPESLSKQSKAIEEIRQQRKEATGSLEDLEGRLTELDKTISTTGKDSEDHQRALAEKEMVEAEMRRKQMAEDYLRAQESRVFLMDADQLEGMDSTADILKAAATDLRKSGGDLDVAARHLSTEEFSDLSNALAGNTVTKNVGSAPSSGGARGAAAGVDASDAVRTVVDADATAAAQVATLESILYDSYALDAEGAAQILAMSNTSAEALASTKKQAEADRMWMKSGFQKKAEVASLDALKAYEGWRLGTYAGLSGSELESAMSEWASGKTTSGEGILAESLAAKGFDPRAYQMQMLGMDNPMANDFVMRPGQPAQRFSSSDTLIGYKPGGPIDAASSKTGGSVVINIHGENSAAIYKIVKDALKTAGVT